MMTKVTVLRALVETITEQPPRQFLRQEAFIDPSEQRMLGITLNERGETEATTAEGRRVCYELGQRLLHDVRAFAAERHWTLPRGLTVVWSYQTWGRDDDQTDQPEDPQS